MKRNIRTAFYLVGHDYFWRWLIITWTLLHSLLWVHENSSKRKRKSFFKHLSVSFIFFFLLSQSCCRPYKNVLFTNEMKRLCRATLTDWNVLLKLHPFFSPVHIVINLLFIFIGASLALHLLSFQTFLQGRTHLLLLYPSLYKRDWYIFISSLLLFTTGGSFSLSSIPLYWKNMNIMYVLCCYLPLSSLLLLLLNSNSSRPPFFYVGGSLVRVHHGSIHNNTESTHKR